ncbi:MAG: MerC domain-containing protein [Cytophagia bacterium]|nr:MerC domain-containing protein [Cytophagia bacterium]
MNKSNKNSLALDNWGMGVSLLCSIHCALMPVLIVSSAVAGLQIERLESLEVPMFIMAAVIGSVSVFLTYLNRRKIQPVLFLFAGLLLIMAGGMVDFLWFETPFRVVGSLLIVSAHFVNRKIQKQA